MKIFQKNDKKVIFWKLDIKNGVKSVFDHEYGFSIQNNYYMYVFIKNKFSLRQIFFPPLRRYLTFFKHRQNLEKSAFYENTHFGLFCIYTDTCVYYRRKMRFYGWNSYIGSNGAPLRSTHVLRHEAISLCIVWLERLPRASRSSTRSRVNKYLR